MPYYLIKKRQFAQLLNFGCAPYKNKSVTLKKIYAMGKFKIFNGTPHAINVVEGSTFNPSIRKFTGGTVVMTIPSNGMLNAKIDVEELSPIGEIPIFGKRISGCDPLPEGYDMYIVSALYSSAILKTGADVRKVFTVADPVMSQDGTTFVGCRGLAPLF